MGRMQRPKTVIELCTDNAKIKTGLGGGCAQWAGNALRGKTN